eukprot:1620776-Alexandrium_andersonii.AAC.1
MPWGNRSWQAKEQAVSTMRAQVAVLQQSWQAKAASVDQHKDDVQMQKVQKMWGNLERATQEILEQQ